MKGSYGIVVARQTIESYDPTKTAGARLAPKWIAIFEATRETFVKDVRKIGISHKAVRCAVFSVWRTRLRSRETLLSSCRYWSKPQG
ncbi:DUF2280 domain-containing protein [Rhizobium leguminosarum]|uniref:DUF2280 domain-containing protein n=1 Tax=Rhizobium leguminosarum TaxID=384 RepID=UPI0021B0D78E|nr:DUF2280 domain-containing protein [Rhizobium leguminosarum]